MVREQQAAMAAEAMAQQAATEANEAALRRDLYKRTTVPGPAVLAVAVDITAVVAVNEQLSISRADKLLAQAAADSTTAESPSIEDLRSSGSGVEARDATTTSVPDEARLSGTDVSSAASVAEQCGSAGGVGVVVTGGCESLPGGSHGPTALSSNVDLHSTVNEQDDIRSSE